MVNGAYNGLQPRRIQLSQNYVGSLKVGPQFNRRLSSLNPFDSQAGLVPGRGGKLGDPRRGSSPAMDADGVDIQLPASFRPVCSPGGDPAIDLSACHDRLAWPAGRYPKRFAGSRR